MTTTINNFMQNNENAGDTENLRGFNEFGRGNESPSFYTPHPNRGKVDLQ